MKGKAYRKAERITWRDLRRKADKDGNYEYDYDHWYNNKLPLTAEQIAQKKQNKLIIKGAVICIIWIVAVIGISLVT